jgi:hypothetical protein
MGTAWLDEHLPHRKLQLTTPTLQISPIASPPTLPHSSASQSPRHSPSPSLLAPPLQFIGRHRSLSGASSDIPALSKKQQDDLEKQFLRVIVSAGLPFRLSEDPEMIKFMHMLNPAFKLPLRDKVSGPLLSAEFDAVQNSLADVMHGAYATGQCDGWRDTSRNHLVAFMVSANRMVCLPFNPAILSPLTLYLL